MTDDSTPTDARILAVLERILAVQTELVVQLRQANDAGAALAEESVALQRQAAERAVVSVDIQRKSARLYRRVVSTLGIVLLAAVALIVYVFVFG